MGGKVVDPEKLNSDPFIQRVLQDAERVAAVSYTHLGKTVTVKSVERKEKSEKAPALYDLTSLQRDANRVLGYTCLLYTSRCV